MQPEQSNAGQQPVLLSKPQENKIDFVKFLPLATGLLIFFGVSRLIFYYLLFDFDIIPYLEFGEILTSFLGVFTIIMLVMIPTLMVFLFFPNIFRNSEFEIEKLEDLKVSGEITKKKVNSYLILAAIFACLFIIYYILWRFPLSVLWPVGIILIPILIPSLTKKRFRKHPIRFVSHIVSFVSYFLSAELFVLCSTWTEYKNVVNYQTLGTTINFDKDVLLKDGSHVFVSDSSHFFIGKTNNYVFTYDAKEHLVTAFPVSTVLQINTKFKKSK